MVVLNIFSPAGYRHEIEPPDSKISSYPEMDDLVEKFTPVFVGGAPRSGTTVLHALLCTSEKTNPYIGECSYFSAFITPYIVGLDNFDVHTRHYFSSEEEFAENHARILRRELTKIWKRVGRPQMLVLKDPSLTASFHHLARLLPKAQFVVSIRDPRDTIASRIEVTRRQKNRSSLNYREIDAFCREYHTIYRTVIRNKAEFGDRLSMVNYSDVVNGKAIPALENMGIGKIYPDSIWKEVITDIRVYAQNEWATPLYGQKLSTASIGRHSNVLSPAIEAFIVRRCGTLAREMGLAVEITRSFPSKALQYYDLCKRNFFLFSVAQTARSFTR